MKARRTTDSNLRRRRLPALAAASLVSLAASGHAMTCPVCFGAKGDPINDYLGVAIMFLLVFVLGILASVVAFFVMSAIKSKRLEAMEAALVAEDKQEAGRWISRSHHNTFTETSHA